MSMFTTTAGNLAAQKQAGMFDEPEAPEAFELSAPESSPTIDQATAHGAKFTRQGRDWLASAHRKGRPVALATFIGPTQHEAAALFCAYFHIKTTKEANHG